MRRAALEVLACPNCLSPLEAEGEVVDVGRLLCRHEGLSFPVEDGVPFLVRPDRAADLEAFAISYGQAWGREGWGAAEEGYLLGLPHVDTTGRQRQKWRVKARSMVALLAALEGSFLRRIVDLGAGMGWLSHHLARGGYEVYAVDALRDDVLGLGAARTYLRHGPPFERIWGELERPPFRNGSVDAVICNASLHYTPSLATVVEEVARILRPGGVFAILNSPVHQDSLSALRAQQDFRRRLRDLGASEEVTSRYHHLQRGVLETVVGEEVGPLEEVRFDPGPWFRLSRAMKGFLLQMELASFPILLARKAGEAGGGRDHG